MEGKSKLQELIGDELLMNKDGEVKTIPFMDFMQTFRSKGQFVCLYFGAHWAPPSRLFTKTLEKRFYEEVNADGIVAEVIFVTDDRAPDHFERNFSKMPWLAIPYADEHKKQTLKSRFGVCEIPTLVVISANSCELITHDGRDHILDGKAAIKNWTDSMAAQGQPD